MAPELLQKKKYEKKVDIWAIGVVIFNMIFGRLPFRSMNMEAEILSKCEKGFDISSFDTELDAKAKNKLNSLFNHVFQVDP
jgi:serine/threonine-protein kinase ULK/ATG1